MKIKEGAILQGLDIRMRPALIEANKVWHSYGQELVVTAGLDGAHSAGSLHYYGLALDLRTRYFDNDTQTEVAIELRKKLAGYFYFDVILHESHIHVEYDKKT
jgi:hypothetical protein